MAEQGPRFQDGQGQATGFESDSIKAMWGSMQARAKARRAQSQPCGQGELLRALRSMDHFSSTLSGSTSPSVSGVSTPRSEARSDISTGEDDSIGSERGEDGGAQWVYSVPRGCRVKNGFIEFDEYDGEDLPPIRDPAPAWRPGPPLSPRTSASVALGHSTHGACDMPIPAADEPERVGMSRAGGGGRGSPAAAASSRELRDVPPESAGPEAAGEASGKARGGAADASNIKSRPRPSKPKRLQGKALAERLFRAQWRGSKDEIARAREAFQEDTKGDPLMQSYTLSVLRCLNSEASSKAANGEDPMLIATHA